MSSVIRLEGASNKYFKDRPHSFPIEIRFYII
jgi:hypothetical protein